jgi:nucleotide-binding universal stress UspA family protein
MVDSLRTLVAGIAELDSQDPVLVYGTRLAEEIGAALHVVFAFPSPFELASLSAVPGIALAPDVVDPVQVVDMKGRLLERLQEVVRERSGAPRIECHVVPDAPHAALAQAVSKVGADLLLIGPARRGKLGQTLLGTTASRVFRTVPVPVLVLRQLLPRTIARVMLGTDLSELSGKAYQAGIAVVRSLFERVEMRSLLVVGEPYGNVLPLIDEEGLKVSAAGRHRRFLETHGFSDVGLEAHVRTGSPAVEIVAEAEEWTADLVVLGTHGRSGLSRAFIGSVAESTLRNLDGNALVIPATMFSEDGPVETRG